VNSRPLMVNLNKVMAKTPELKNPPIIEAVLDIDCEFKSSLDIKAIEAEASRLLAKQYPKKRPIILQNHKFEPNEYSVKSGLTAYQFLKNDEKQLVRFDGARKLETDAGENYRA
jgi:uncharacterized protein (TIGR04255 family)